MNERKTRRYVTLASAIVVAAFVACTDGGETISFVNDCLEDTTLDAGCSSGDVPYSCANGSLPSDSDPTLVCENGHVGSNGETVFCCVAPTSSTTPTCALTNTVTCPENEIAYTCSGTNTPSGSDPGLSCEASGTDNDYCCITDAGATSPGCSFGSDAGCADAGPIAFVCPSNATPDTADPTLTCSAPVALSDGFASYCCSH